MWKKIFDDEEKEKEEEDKKIKKDAQALAREQLSKAAKEARADLEKEKEEEEAPKKEPGTPGPRGPRGPEGPRGDTGQSESRRRLFKGKDHLFDWFPGRDRTKEILEKEGFLQSGGSGLGFVPDLPPKEEDLSMLLGDESASVPTEEAMSDIFDSGSGAKPQQAASATMTVESLGLGDEDTHALRTLYEEGMKTRNPALEQHFMQLAQDLAAQSSAYNVSDIIGAVEREYTEGQKPTAGDPYPGYENLIYREFNSKTGKWSVGPAEGYTWDKEKGGHAVKPKRK